MEFNFNNDYCNWYRQQSHHLGISNNTINERDGSNRKRSISTSTQIVPTKVVTDNLNDEINGTEIFDVVDDNKQNDDSTDVTNTITTAPMPLMEQLIEQDVPDDIWQIPIALEKLDEFDTDDYKRSELRDIRSNVVHRVSVLIRNITLMSEDESKHPDYQVESLIQRLAGLTVFIWFFFFKYFTQNCLSFFRAGSSKTNFPRNQTEIIYSVFVDSKPVLAITAADDMKLLSEDEVADVMEKMIYTKAERKCTMNFINSPFDMIKNLIFLKHIGRNRKRHH